MSKLMARVLGLVVLVAAGLSPTVWTAPPAGATTTRVEIEAVPWDGPCWFKAGSAYGSSGSGFRYCNSSGKILPIPFTVAEGHSASINLVVFQHTSLVRQYRYRVDGGTWTTATIATGNMAGWVSMFSGVDISAGNHTLEIEGGYLRADYLEVVSSPVPNPDQGWAAPFSISGAADVWVGLQARPQVAADGSTFFSYYADGDFSYGGNTYDADEAWNGAVMALDADGGVRWNVSAPPGLTFGDVLLTPAGLLVDASVISDPVEMGGEMLTSTAFVMVSADTGQVLWVSAYDAAVHSKAFDESGNIYLALNSSEEWRIGEMAVAPGTASAAVARIDAAGETDWIVEVGQLDGTMFLTTSADDVIVAAYTNDGDLLDGSTYAVDSIVFRSIAGADGTTNWTTHYTSADSEGQGMVPMPPALGFVGDQTGGAYMSLWTSLNPGVTSNTIAFAGGLSHTITATTAGAVAHLDGTGSWRWVSEVSGPVTPDRCCAELLAGPNGPYLTILSEAPLSAPNVTGALILDPGELTGYALEVDSGGNFTMASAVTMSPNGSMGFLTPSYWGAEISELQTIDGVTYTPTGAQDIVIRRIR